MSTCRIAALALACSLAWPFSIQAQEARPSGNSKEYRHLIDDAIAEHEARNFVEARALFRQAHALWPNARTLRGMGMMEFELKNYVDAVDLLQQAIASAVKGLDGAARQEAERLLMRARAFVAQVSLELRPAVAGAQISIDGDPLFEALGTPIALNIGTHTLIVRAPGYAEVSRSLNLKDATEQHELIELSAAPPVGPAASAPPTAAPAPSVLTSYSGDIHFESDAPGTIRLDRASVGSAPLDMHDVSAGMHVVRIDFDEGSKEARRILVQAGQTTKVHFEVPPLIEAGRMRKGVGFVFGGGPFMDMMEFKYPGGGAQLFAGINVGLKPRLDFRVVAYVGAGTYLPLTHNFDSNFHVGLDETSGSGFDAGVRPALRINFGALYSIELGAELGIYYSSFEGKRFEYVGGRNVETHVEDTHASIAYGPEISFLSFRLGARRQYELTCWQDALFGLSDSIDYRAGLSLTYLLLPTRD